MASGKHPMAMHNIAEKKCASTLLGSIARARENACSAPLQSHSCPNLRRPIDTWASGRPGSSSSAFTAAARDGDSTCLNVVAPQIPRHHHAWERPAYAAAELG